MLRRIKLSNVSDNKNIDALGRLDKNHPRWYFTTPIYARSMRVSKVTIPLSYYSGIRALDSNSFFKDVVANIEYPITLKPAGFKTMNDMLSVLSYRLTKAIESTMDEVTLVYDDILDRIVMTIDDGSGGAPSINWELHIKSYDLADLLGIQFGSIAYFDEGALVTDPYIFKFYKETNATPVQPVIASEVASDTLLYPFPYSPSIMGPTYLFLRSNVLNGFSAGGYGTGTGIAESGNILAAIEINQTFNTTLTTQLYDSCMLKFHAQGQSIQNLDLYFTAEAKRRNLNEAERIIDFNGQRWSVELEFELVNSVDSY